MVIHCGLYGHFVWPMWFVADMVQTSQHFIHVLCKGTFNNKYYNNVRFNLFDISCLNWIGMAHCTEITRSSPM